MKGLGENRQRHPLTLAQADERAHEISEAHADLENEIRVKSRELARAEREYRKALSVRILQLKAKGFAITMCGEIARGEDRIADLRFTRDVAEGDLEAVRQRAFADGADRRDESALLKWSMNVDLRTDTPPPGGYRRPAPVGKPQGYERPKAVGE